MLVYRQSDRSLIVLFNKKTMILELTTSVLFLLGTFSSANKMDAAINKDSNQLPLGVIVTSVINQPFTLEDYIREYFRETPLLAEIARCESRFRHFGSNGRVIRGERSAEDVGVMQINEFYHEDTAKMLGFDLHTLDGNLAYAKWLYAKEGIAPWLSSSRCWQKSNTLAKADIKAATD